MMNHSEMTPGTRFDNLLVRGTIGQGHQSPSTIYCVEDLLKGAILAMKESGPSKASIRSLHQEFSTLQRIASHPNIIKCHEQKYLRVVEPINGTVFLLHFFLMEYFEKGDLLRLLEKSGRFPEPIARFFFLKVLNALNHVHMHGFVHKDVSLENILFSNEGEPILADFGSAEEGCLKERTMEFQEASERGEQGPQVQENANPNLMSPERAFGDYFAAAIMVFTMVFGQPPFRKQNYSNDRLYRLMVSKRFREFWNAHSSGQGRAGEPCFSASLEFQDLFEKMTGFSEQQRLTRLEDILSHSWCVQSLPSTTEVMAYFGQA